MLFRAIAWCYNRARDRRIARLRRKIEPLFSLDKQMKKWGVPDETPDRRMPYTRVSRGSFSTGMSDAAMNDGRWPLPDGRSAECIILHGEISCVDTHLPRIAKALRQRGENVDADLVDQVVKKLEDWRKLTGKKVIATGEKPGAILPPDAE